MPLTEAQRAAIRNALVFIEAQHGHKDGAVYEDLAEALREIEAKTAEEFYRPVQCECRIDGRLLRGEIGVAFSEEDEVCLQVGRPGAAIVAYLNRSQLAALSAALAEASGFLVKL